MKKSLLTLLTVLICVSSCITDALDTADKVANIKGVVWNPTIAVPLVYSRLKLSDLLEEAGDLEYLRIEDDGGMTLVYTNETETPIAEDQIQLDDQSYNETFVLTPGDLADLNTNGVLTKTYNLELDYESGSNELDLIRFKQGDFTIGLNTTLEHEVEVRFIIDGGTLNGSPFIPTVSTVGTNPRTYDMNGAELDLTQTTQGHSQFNVQLEVTVTKTGNNPIKPVETIDYSVSIINQRFRYMQGMFDFGNFSSAESGLDLDFFSTSTGGSFTLADPRVKLIFRNSLGFPVDASVIQFDGISAKNTTVALTGIPDPLPIPNLTLADVGQTLVDSFSLNKSNSNIADFVNNRPADILYEVAVDQANGGVDRQWVLDTSKVGVRAEVKVPLEGTARDYVLESTYPFDDGLESTEEIEQVLVRLYTENGFPVDVAIQVYLEDSITNTVLDSLITGDILILPSANVDASGKVSSVNPKTTDVTVSDQGIQNFKDANRVRLKAYFNTPYDADGTTQPDVKFFDFYDVLIQLGVQAEILAEVDLDQ